MPVTDDLERIKHALQQARDIARPFTSGNVASRRKAGGDPVTQLDLELDSLLKRILRTPGDGWLSEETADDESRLTCRRVWIVDPLDGTREFIEGIPEWCISVALMQEGVLVAGGICNPATGEQFLGAVGQGVTLDGVPVSVKADAVLSGASVLASRSEVKAGRWARFAGSPFDVIPCGSVAYKLARVSAGLADATFTLVPKNYWDIAAGVVLVQAATGIVADPSGASLDFSSQSTLVPGLVAGPAELVSGLLAYIHGRPS